MAPNARTLALGLASLLLCLAPAGGDVAHATPPRTTSISRDVRPARVARLRRERPLDERRVVPLADRVPHLPGGAPIVITPVLFVPSDGAYARWSEADTAMRAHVAIAQAHYRSLLGTTFAAARAPLPIVRGALTAAEYEADPGTRANAITRELFAWAETDRYASAHVFVVLYASSSPINGGGIPFNGTLGTGGGYVELDARALLEDSPYPFQSSLVHEIGHALGLDHVACRGESMTHHPSLMSYDASHHSSGIAPSADPGGFLPIEIAALALSPRALPNVRTTWSPTTEAELAQAERCLLPAMGEAIGAYRDLPGVGLELFYGARRVNGPDASLYPRARAIEVCREARDRSPRVRVTCRYNGEALRF